MNTPVAPRWFNDAIAAPFESRTVDVAGCSINYLAWGDQSKPQLLLVHGGAAHAMWWSFIAPMLSRNYYVIAPDLSGHGDSGQRVSYSMFTWAEEILAVSADAGGQSPPFLVGHSMGGMVSIVTAATHGDRLAGLVIADSNTKRLDKDDNAASKGWRKLITERRVCSNREEAIGRFRLLPPQPCENAFIFRYVAEHSVKQVEDGWTWKFDANIFSGLTSVKLGEYLARVDCRVAMLRGELSVSLPVETAQYMYEMLNCKAPLVEIPQAHHHLMLDQPLAFVSALRMLLAGWDHSAGPSKTPAVKP